MPFTGQLGTPGSSPGNVELGFSPLTRGAPAATFGTSILQPLDAIRAIGGILGLRPTQAKILVRSWSGERIGVGNKTDVEYGIFNQGADGSIQPVKVRQLTRREVIAYQGLYTERDWRVGPITPPYPAILRMVAAGFDDTILDIAPQTSPTEIVWVLSSPVGTFGFPHAQIAAKIGEQATALHYYIFLRATGEIL